LGIPRTTPAITLLGPTSPVPAVSGPIVIAESFSISNGIATIVLGPNNLTNVGYNGPDGFNNVNSNGSPMDLYAGNRGQGQQVTLWGWSVATYFNGLTVTVLDNNPTAGSFRFSFNHANVASTADTGNTAADISTWSGGASGSEPGIAGGEHFRVVRIEVDQANGTDIVYVGDLNVSTTRYVAALSLAGQLAIEVASENIPGDRIFMVSTTDTDKVHVSLIM
jgi:hypothetical protein